MASITSWPLSLTQWMTSVYHVGDEKVYLGGRIVFLRSLVSYLWTQTEYMFMFRQAAPQKRWSKEETVCLCCYLHFTASLSRKWVEMLIVSDGWFCNTVILKTEHFIIISLVWVWWSVSWLGNVWITFTFFLFSFYVGSLRWVTLLQPLFRINFFYLKCTY